jgi:DNA-binding LacI/PurR family transcriptional regulator
MSSKNQTSHDSVKMKDVAEHAEVSLMTISRVLNTPEKVSQ